MMLPIVKGTLDVLVLKALSWTPMHGFEVTRWLEDGSSGRLDIDDSALYQALYRLEARGLVQANWGVTENNRRARYYALTERGEEYLASESERLTEYAALLATILSLDPDGAA